MAYKRLTLDELSDEGTINLIGAIMHQAMHDYKNAIKRHNPKKSYEDFFRSEHFSNLTHLNGDYIIKETQRIAMEELEEEKEKMESNLPRKRNRKKKKTYKCKWYSGPLG